MAQHSAIADVAQLTEFKLGVLATVAALQDEETEHDKPHGLAIKRRLEDTRHEEVHPGRLYPNMDDLVDAGYLRKSSIDKRTNGYELTQRGEGVVSGFGAYLVESAGGEA